MGPVRVHLQQFGHAAQFGIDQTVPAPERIARGEHFHPLVGFQKAFLPGQGITAHPGGGLGQQRVDLIGVALNGKGAAHIVFGPDFGIAGDVKRYQRAEQDRQGQGDHHQALQRQGPVSPEPGHPPRRHAAAHGCSVRATRTAAWVRSATPSLAMIRSTWALTVAGLTAS